MYSVYPKLKIVEDEYGSTEFQRGYKEYVINNRPEYNFFGEYDFDFVDSRHSNVVQIADIIAGSIMQHLIDSSAHDAMKMFRGKIVDVVNFPESYQVYSPNSEGKNEYDAAIYSLAVKRATDYIERNKNDTSPEIRMRVHFLRYDVLNLNFPLLVRTGAEYDKARYYSEPLHINGAEYVMCSQWIERPENNDRPYLMSWIREHQ